MLCISAEGSEQPAHDEWGGSSSLFRKAFSASREWCGIETPTRDSMSVSGASMRGIEHPYVRTSCACPPTPLNDRSGQGVSPGRDGRVGGMVEMARSQCRSSISYLCVGVSWTDASVV